jgi:hypothetical protein
MKPISRKLHAGCESWIATLEVLSDKKLTSRLLKLAKTVDDNVATGRLYSMEDVFSEQPKK